VPRLSLPSIERVPGGRAFASLSRRVRALIVAGVLFIVLFVLALTMPVPYVILSPGPTFNTLGKDPYSSSDVIVLNGTTSKSTSGNLNMTTVSVSGDDVSAFQALWGWLQGDEVVVPTSSVYPPGTTQKQTDQQNAQDFTQSQDNATAAALCQLGYPKGFGVIDVVASGPSQGKLKPGDALRSVDGKATTTTAQLTSVLTALTPGTTVPVAVTRGGRTVTVDVKLGTYPKQPGVQQRAGGYLGIVPDTTCLAPFTVTINLEDVGGPSAGMMFALGIIDKIGKVDLTGGKFIAGTGTIDPDGKVGPIGGIQLKMIAARRKGASVFLAPSGNCSDVKGAIPSGLKVVKVGTLSEAVDDLQRIQKGESVPSC
jgi:Lon-like protease